MSFRTISVRLTGNASSLNSALYQASRTIGDFGRSIERGAAGSLLRFGAVATIAGTAAYALERAFTASVRQAVAFDAAMRNVNSISGLSERQLGALGRQVLDLSTKVPQSATNLAGGLYQIASSGFQGAQGLTILRASAIAATAGLTDTATSAQVIVGALNAYGLGADQATKVSDELFQTVNVGVLNFNDLAQGLGEVTGGAAAAKVPLADLGAAVATMTRAGVVPAESFTSLNRVIISILQPSDALAAVFKQLGYESGAAALQSKGLHGVIEDIRRSTGGSAQAMYQLFTDVRGARGALALMSNQGRLYNEVAGQFTDQTEIQGRTLKTFQEQMKSVSAQWQLFKNRVSAVSIEAATHLLPAILSLIHSMTDLGHAAGHVFSDLAPFFTALRNVGADLVTVFQATLSVASPLAKAIAGLVGGAIIATLNELGQTIASVTDFLAKHKTIVEAVAAVYIARMLPALQIAAWKALSAVIVALDTVIFGFLGTLGKGATGLKDFVTGMNLAKIGSAAATFELIGIGAELMVFQASAQRASQHAKDLAAGFDVLDGAADKSKAAVTLLNQDISEAEHTLRSYGSSWRQFGLGLAQVLTPFTSNTVLNAANARKASKKELDQMIVDYNTTLSELTQVAVDSGAIQASSLTQLNPLYAKTAADLARLQTPVGHAQEKLAALAKLAEQLNLGDALAAGGPAAEAARKTLSEAWKSIGTDVGTTTEAIGKLTDFDIDKMQELAKAVQDAGDATSKAFLAATDVVANFQPAQAADDLAAAQERVSGAQRGVRDATEKLSDARAKESKTSDQAKEKARALRDATEGLADANKNAAKAHDDLVAAQKRGDLTAFYKDTIKTANAFADNVEKAMARGLDPRFVQRLLEAGPQQAGPLLDQLVADHSGRMIGLVNTSEEALRRINERVIRFSQLTELAIHAPVESAQRMAGELSDAMRAAEVVLEHPGWTVDQVARALGLSKDRAAQIGDDFGITFATHAHAAVASHPIKIVTGADGTVHIGTKIAAAAGGYITGAGTTTSDSIHALLSNKEFVQPANAVAYYGVPFMEAVRRLQLPRFAGGGPVNPLRRFADGGMARTTAPTIVRVVEQPATYVTRHETNVGEVRPYDSREFLEWMARQRRDKALRP